MSWACFTCSELLRRQVTCSCLWWDEHGDEDYYENDREGNMILRMMLMMRIKNNATADNAKEVETTVNDDAADKNQDGH